MPTTSNTGPTEGPPPSTTSDYSADDITPQHTSKMSNAHEQEPTHRSPEMEEALRGGLGMPKRTYGDAWRKGS
jgi:hypothetical protein